MPTGSFAELFEDLAANWRGWLGRKEWRSLEGELRLTAECDRLGHVWITTELGQGSPAAWTATLVVLVEAGQLDGLAPFPCLVRTWCSVLSNER